MDNEKTNQGYNNEEYISPAYGQQSSESSDYESSVDVQQPSSWQIPYQKSPEREVEEPVTYGEWIVTFLLLLIPCVNLILPFVWAFSKTEKKSKSNFFKAYILLSIIATAIGLLVLVSGFVFIAAFMEELMYLL